jgi:orotidine-5'-phosphate decarboxylase
MASLALREPVLESRTQIPVKERLIVALDVPSVGDARALVSRLGDRVAFYKIGMQLQFGGGIAYANELIQQGKKVFLDSKLFDIDETIERAVENIARMGVDFLTVHGNGKTIQAAVRGRGDSRLRIFSVTVLTSLDNADLADLFGSEVDVKELVKSRAEKAFDSGADGVIASGQEADLIRQLVSNKIKVMDATDAASRNSFSIVTPGIRMPGDAVGDQKRVTRPRDAIAAGADYLVVGRPISQAADPAGAAEAVLKDIGFGLDGS